MSATGSSGSLLERYTGIRSAVNAIRTRLVDSLTGLSNRALRTRFNSPIPKSLSRERVMAKVGGVRSAELPCSCR